MLKLIINCIKLITYFPFSRIDSDILSKIIGNINILLYDENVNIKKKVILSMASLYKTAIKVGYFISIQTMLFDSGPLYRKEI